MSEYFLAGWLDAAAVPARRPAVVSNGSMGAGKIVGPTGRGWSFLADLFDVAVWAGPAEGVCCLAMGVVVNVRIVVGRSSWTAALRDTADMLSGKGVDS